MEGRVAKNSLLLGQKTWEVIIIQSVRLGKSQLSYRLTTLLKQQGIGSNGLLDNLMLMKVDYYGYRRNPGDNLQSV